VGEIVVAKRGKNECEKILSGGKEKGEAPRKEKSSSKNEEPGVGVEKNRERDKKR